MDLRAMKSKAHEKISRKNRPSSGIFFLAGSGTKMPYGYSVRRKCRKCGPQSAALSFPAVGGEPVRRSLWRNSPSSEYENRRVGNDGSKTVARALKSESQRRPRDGAGWKIGIISSHELRLKGPRRFIVSARSKYGSQTRRFVHKSELFTRKTDR